MQITTVGLDLAKPVPLFQLIARDDPPGGDDLREVSPLSLNEFPDIAPGSEVEAS
jgi:hypothetical protein